MRGGSQGPEPPHSVIPSSTGVSPPLGSFPGTQRYGVSRSTMRWTDPRLVLSSGIQEEGLIVVELSGNVGTWVEVGQ